jgi:hypothetical protein
MNDVLIDDYEECGQDDVLQFESWYHSVMDDVASLIRANGYDKVMYDIQCAVERMSKEHSSVKDVKGDEQ